MCLLPQVHGANPGLISHFVKQALLNVATDTGVTEAPGYVRDAAHRIK